MATDENKRNAELNSILERLDAAERKVSANPAPAKPATPKPATAKPKKQPKKGAKAKADSNKKSQTAKRNLPSGGAPKASTARRNERHERENERKQRSYARQREHINKKMGLDIEEPEKTVESETAKPAPKRNTTGEELKKKLAKLKEELDAKATAVKTNLKVKAEALKAKVKVKSERFKAKLNEFKAKAKDGLAKTKQKLKNATEKVGDFFNEVSLRFDAAGERVLNKIKSSRAYDVLTGHKTIRDFRNHMASTDPAIEVAGAKPDETSTEEETIDPPPAGSVPPVPPTPPDGSVPPTPPWISWRRWISWG